MRLNVLSDLHLSMARLEAPRTDPDIVVLAGDISRPREAVEWALGLGKPVIYVPGNHEFYGGSLVCSLVELRDLCDGTTIHLLHQDELVIDGIRFLGVTLWTDFQLSADPEANALSMEKGRVLLRDFRRIRQSDEGDGLFTPEAAARIYTAQAAWLERKLATKFSGRLWWSHTMRRLSEASTRVLPVHR